MNLSNICFDEKYFNEELGETTLYFTAPIDILNSYFADKYSDAVMCEISIDFPAHHEDFIGTPDECCIFRSV